MSSDLLVYVVVSLLLTYSLWIVPLRIVRAIKS